MIDQTKSRRGTCLFWATLPLLSPFGIMMTFGGIMDMLQGKDGLLITFIGICCFIMMTILYNPDKAQFAIKTAGLIVCSLYTWYLVIMIWDFAHGKAVFSSNKTPVTLMNAIIGMILIGIPALKYATWGRPAKPDYREFVNVLLTNTEPDSKREDAATALYLIDEAYVFEALKKVILNADESNELRVSAAISYIADYIEEDKLDTGLALLPNDIAKQLEQLDFSQHKSEAKIT